MAEQTQNPPPSHDELEDLMLSCRYGDLEDVQAFVDRFGWTPLDEVRDESGNTILHMICGNGHLGWYPRFCLPRSFSCGDFSFCAYTSA